MNALSATLLVGLLLAVLVAPRRWALLAVVAAVLFLTQGQAVSVGGLSIWPFRFIEVAAFARVLVRRELAGRNLSSLDALVLLAYNYTAIVWMVRSSEFSAEQLGFAVDHTVSYLAFRGLVAKLEDVRWLLVALLALLIPFTALVALERVTGRSSFEIVGGTWQLYVRDGITRAQGPFRHASLLGSVAAAFLAMYIGLWWRRQDRVVAALGVTLSLALVVMTHSGGPMTSTLAALAGWAMWRLRTRMRLVRYAVFGTTVALVLFMKAPIWYLPYKISELVGGGGYHRSLLMESAWNDLGRWWLFGMELKNTIPWIPYAHGETGGADITNEFVAVGIKAGLLALLLWILVLTRAFSAVGVQLAAIRARDARDLPTEALLWGAGVALVVHAVSWLGIAYFDQSWAIWLLNAAVVLAPADCLSRQAAGDSNRVSPAEPLRSGSSRWRWKSHRGAPIPTVAVPSRTFAFHRRSPY